MPIFRWGKPSGLPPRQEESRSPDDQSALADRAASRIAGKIYFILVFSLNGITFQITFKLGHLELDTQAFSI